MLNFHPEKYWVNVSYFSLILFWDSAYMCFFVGPIDMSLAVNYGKQD